MKSDGIQRSVRVQKFDRAAGDAPGLGKVSRMPGAGQSRPKGERRRRRTDSRKPESRQQQNRRVIVVIWTGVLTLAATVALGVLIWLELRRGSEVLHPAVAADLGEPVAGSESSAAATAFPTEELALARLDEALAARTPEQVEATFRHGPEIPAETIVSFLTNLSKVDGEILNRQIYANQKLNGIAASLLLVNFKKDGKPRNRLAVLVQDAAGVWKVDFEAFARTVTPAWADILKLETKEARVRVYVAKDNYYLGAFQDESQWVCYGLASPDAEEILMGYCQRNSAQARAMEALIGRGGALSRTTLDLRRREGGKERQFEITSVVAEDWLVGDKAFDSRY